MPRSFLVKKHREWDKIYRKLQWSIDQTAYKPDQTSKLPSSIPAVSIPHHEPLRPITKQPCHDSNLATVSSSIITYPPVLVPFTNILFPTTGLLTHAYGTEQNRFNPNTKEFTRSPHILSPVHVVNPLSTSDDENCSPSQSPSRSSGSDGELLYTPSKIRRAWSSTERKPKSGKLSCPDCGKLYCTGGGLNKHRQTQCRARQAGKSFQCKYCPKEYNALGALKMHLRTHTLPCKCGLCGKAFSRPWLLQGHIRTHTGEKPFSCPHCQRAFADRSNLRAHLQTHSDVKRYSCERCLRTFSRMSLLQKHKVSGCNRS